MLKRYEVQIRSYFRFGTNNTYAFSSQGRLAIEWVIQKINDEIKDLSTSAAKSTDEFIHHTKKSFDDIAHTAKKSMDDLSSVAKKSLDELLPAAAHPQTPPHPMPKF